MLVLTRKVGQRIRIGDTVELTVLRIAGGKVKLGFTGPEGVSIQREEICEHATADAAPGRLEWGEVP